MIKYEGRSAYIDGHKFIKDRKTGYYLSNHRIGEKRTRLHVYVWEKYNGKTPEGYHIHHKDHNKDNNEMENLELMTQAEHLRLHVMERTEEQKEKMRENLINKAIPASKEWHRSEEGRAWHVEHGKECWKDRQPRKYICSNCGKEFESLNIYSETENRFCSNNCKSAYRRKSGVDDVIRKCEYCGKEFKVNKYAKRKYCDEHRSPKSRKS